MKTDTKITVITTICSLAFLAAIVIVKVNEPFNKSYFKGYKDSWAEKILKESCNKMNTILPGKLNWKRIPLAISQEFEKREKSHYNGWESTYMIVINENMMDPKGNIIKYNENKDLFTSVLNHELIHCYVEKYYPQEKENKNNLNHRGKFKEIEALLIKNGMILHQNYIHEYIED